ncbi:hypothetical protein [Thermoactinomyces sp. DSM 45892]|uniref:hypothetical protein n=1 Tax=Thermoactinomyces sp. DSM 45892 TaxID=1882753 RepID=UPI00089A133C|nr:hypothetical protein [Thermoactinomyces sp. DSM 45892]SDX95777.1 hypothetical protein SAMN05444416_101101 [Thermoactinomyces sp. DSM 45892]
MAKSKSEIKRLTSHELKKQDKKLEGTYPVDLVINETVYEIIVDEHFRKSKIFQLLDDMIRFYNEANKPLNASLLELSTPYSTLLIIKHFTDFEVSDDINEALAVLNLLIDLDLLDKILNAMPEQEITKVYEMLSQMLTNMQVNLEEAEKQADELGKQVANSEVKTLVQ